MGLSRSLDLSEEQRKDSTEQTKLESSVTIANGARVGNGVDALGMADEVELGLGEDETPGDAIGALSVGPALGEALGMVDAVIVGQTEGEALGKGAPVGVSLGKVLGIVDAVTVGRFEGEALGKGPPVGRVVRNALQTIDAVTVGRHLVILTNLAFRRVKS